MLLPRELEMILAETPELGNAFLVGGCVRDYLLHAPLKDYDVEVYGLNYELLASVLARWGRTDVVGRSFGVVKLTTGSGCHYDFSIPRRDSKMGPGHKGFEATFDPGITPREAASRRDFTINALMWDPRKAVLLDFFGGEEDLRQRRLRHVGDAFREDPLRVLRGMQFAGRYRLRADPETAALCRSMLPEYSELPLERVREEWFKWAGRSVEPSLGLLFLVESGWIAHFPEIQQLIGCAQDPEWHPEGDVFVHTGHCCDAMATLPEWQAADEDSRVTLMLAILAHDFGKPSTTHLAERDGRLRVVSPGHESAGGPVALSFLERIQAPLAIRDCVVPLVTNHLAHLQTINDRAVRRLARRLMPETIAHLCLVIIADQFGRPPRPKLPSVTVEALRQRAMTLQLEEAAPKPMLQGRHLIGLGWKPGPELGLVLREAFEAQLDGEFEDVEGALAWLASRQAGSGPGA